MSQFENIDPVNLVQRGGCSVEILRYCTWRDQIKPRLLLSFLWCAPFRGSFFRMYFKYFTLVFIFIVREVVQSDIVQSG